MEFVRHFHQHAEEFVEGGCGFVSMSDYFLLDNPKR